MLAAWIRMLWVPTGIAISWIEPAPADPLMVSVVPSGKRGEQVGRSGARVPPLARGEEAQRFIAGGPGCGANHAGRPRLDPVVPAVPFVVLSPPPLRIGRRFAEGAPCEQVSLPGHRDQVRPSRAQQISDSG